MPLLVPVGLHHSHDTAFSSAPLPNVEIPVLKKAYSYIIALCHYYITTGP